VTTRDTALGIAVLVLCTALAFGISCSSTLGEPASPQEEMAEPLPDFPDQEIVGEEEVLYEEGEVEEDEFGRRKDPTRDAGEIMVAIGYIGMIVGGMLLPLFAL